MQELHGFSLEDILVLVGEIITSGMGSLTCLLIPLIEMKSFHSVDR